MAMQLMIDVERRVVISSGLGSVTDDDLLAGYSLLRDNPKFDPTYDRVWDFAEVTQLQMSDDLLRRFAERSLSAPAVRRAIVCLAPQVVARVLELVDESRESNRDIALFPSREEALKWLALESIGLCR